MLEASIIAAQLQDVRISEGDQFLLYLPGKVQEFLQLYRNATTVQQLFLGVQDYYIRTRVEGDMGSIHVTQPVGSQMSRTRHASTVERRVIWPRIVRNPRSAAIVARRVI